MKENNSKLTRHKKYMIVSFMKCTKKIINEKGIDGVTIRKVAECSNMNSASIYTYFENVDHLIVFSIMDELTEYINDLPNVINNCSNSLEVFYAVWDSFANYSFNNSKAYMKLFFSNLGNDIEYYIKQYYKIFSLDLDKEKYPSYIIEMLNSGTILTRDIYIMNECVKDGFIKEKDVNYINNIIVFTYEGILRRLDSGSFDKNEAIKMFNDYLKKIMELFISRY